MGCRIRRLVAPGFAVCVSFAIVFVIASDFFGVRHYRAVAGIDSEFFHGVGQPVTTMTTGNSRTLVEEEEEHVSSNDTKLAISVDDALVQARSMTSASSEAKDVPLKLKEENAKSSRHTDGITLVVLTVGKDRLFDLNYTISVATDHPDVARIVIIWNDPDRQEEGAAMEKDFASYHKSKKLWIIQASKNSLNNRYTPDLPIDTETVFILDDDIVITADTISCLYESWKQDPRKIHSFGEGRVVSQSGYSLGNPRKSNFLLPRMMFHRKYLSVYFHEEHKKIRDYVDIQGAHCDDIAFASIVTQYYNGSLVYIPAPHAERSRRNGKLKWSSIRRKKDWRKDIYVDVKRNANKGISQAGSAIERFNLRMECSRDIITMLKNWTMPPVQTSTTCNYISAAADVSERRGK